MPSTRICEGFLAPVSAEVTATDLPVTGHIPEHLHGRYLRNGPNPAAEVDPATYHWFSRRRDGARPGAAGRQSAVVPQSLGAYPRGLQPTLGEAQAGRINPRAGMLAIGPNTNVLTHAGRTLALVEAGCANYELTEELDTLGTCDFGGTLAGGYTGAPAPRPENRRAACHFILVRPRPTACSTR